MTRIVVYDRELHEPLTVVEINASWLRAIGNGTHPRTVTFATEPRDVREILSSEVTQLEFHHVHLRLEPVMRNSGWMGRGDPELLFWYAYPDNPELALELRAAFLPGQLSEVRRRERMAFWQGAFMGAQL